MIVYKIIYGLREEPSAVLASTPPLSRELTVINESFALNADYPDPFLPGQDSTSLHVNSGDDTPSYR